VRVEAIETLGTLGPTKAASATPGVTARLKDSSPLVRKAALRALARLGPKETALPAIQGLVNDSDAEVQNTAREMVTYIAPELTPKE
jgi:HEAT repeat protein